MSDKKIYVYLYFIMMMIWNELDSIHVYVTNLIIGLFFQLKKNERWIKRIWKEIKKNSYLFICTF